MSDIEVRNSRIEKKCCLYASCPLDVSQASPCTKYPKSPLHPTIDHKIRFTALAEYIIGQHPVRPQPCPIPSITNFPEHTHFQSTKQNCFLYGYYQVLPYIRIRSFNRVTQPCLVSSSASTRRPTAASSRHLPFVPPSRLGPPRRVSNPRNKKSSKGYRRPRRVHSRHHGRRHE